MNNRIQWADFAKAVSVFLVIIGHTALPHEFRSFIYAFHIPLFFFLSGSFFDFDKYPRAGAFIKKRALQLIVPYFAYNLITYLIWVFAGRFTGEDVNMNIPVFEPLLGVFYGNTNNFFLHHNVPMWFLACLFVCEVLFYLIFRKNSNTQFLITMAVLLIVGYFSSSVFLIPLPWMLNVVAVALVFYAAGYKLKKLAFQAYKNSQLLLTGLVSLAITILISELNGKIEVADADYGNYLLMWIGAFSGILMMVSFSQLISQTRLNLNLLYFTGKSTLTIFALHLTAGSVIKGFSYFILKQPLQIYENVWIIIAYSIGSFLILLPVASFINKYIPVLAGKTKNSSKK